MISILSGWGNISCRVRRSCCILRYYLFMKMLVYSCALILSLGIALSVAATPAVPRDSSPLHVKAAYFHQDLLEKHWLDGLYVSIVPSPAPGEKLTHTVDEPGNVIHAGAWTGRYLGGVGYHYAATKDPWVRKHGGEIPNPLPIQPEGTGKPGPHARRFIKGHGPGRR